ncbi:SusC/RagA family TonB-linked outer membrane protein [Sphingobacterium sp. HJSM2_6]|uniref:SusC/RagA family TonB-linked outer membrane protein n=1 Tax=Sphingobacterium sp. HJSM2_6 TaxID=3366264 RepID=UPI003BE4595C
MEELKKQTGYQYFLQGREIAYQEIDVHVVNQPFNKTMDQILSGLSLNWTMEDETIVISKSTKTVKQVLQQRIVRGTVSNEQGQPLSGVTVAVAQTTLATVSNENGEFEIQVPNDLSSLQFKFMGYLDEVMLIEDNAPLKVVLKAKVSDLDEVVVVGMNIRQAKRSVTGSLATIQTKELKQSPVANLNNALAGRLPGLISVQSTGQPGDDASSLYIRGIATYGSNTAPLIVIDGLPRGQGSFSQIDPNEVESVSILKDASSSALYGIQGANGVIVVTTKRGREGQKPAIDFTAQQAVQQVVRLPKPISTYESALYFNQYDFNNNSTPRFSEEALEIVRNGSEPHLYPDINWYDEILEKSALQGQYNLNVSGNSNRVRYFVSGSHINQGALLKYSDVLNDNYGKTSGFSRYNFRSNVDIQATKGLSIQVDLAGRLEQRIGPSSGFNEVFNQISNVPPFALPIFNPDGTLGAASNVEIPFWRNPYGLVTQSGYYESSTNVMYGTISAKHDLNFFLKGLSAQGFFSFENNNINHTVRSQEFDSFWYRGLDIDGLPMYQQTRIASTLGTSGYNNIERSNYMDFRLQYQNSWNDHEVSAQALFNRTFRSFNYELPYAYQGVSARTTYAFRKKYFVEANLSYNGSENFPKGERYGFFPSVSAGWVISDESFLKEVDGLNFMKIRGSYGLVGNDKIGGQRWLYLSDFAGGGGYPFGVTANWKPGYNESRIGNPFVTWETARKSNLGFEISILPQDLLQLTFDVFHEERTDILTQPGTVPDYLGISNLAPLNAGRVINKGIDGELRINKKWNDFSVFSNIQFTYSRNQVMENDQPMPAYPYQDLRGYEIGYVLGYKSLGFFQNQAEIDNSALQQFDNKLIPGDLRYQDMNSDGRIDAFDRVPILLQNVPRYMGGLSLGATYKTFDISILLNGAGGGTARYIPKPLDPMILHRWQEGNQENALIPVAKNSSNNTLMSDFYYFKTDYLKLRNAEIGYVIPGERLKKLGFSYVRVFLNGQNLAIWDRLWIKDRDPEVSGSSNLPYPIQRVFNFGLNVRL